MVSLDNLTFAERALVPRLETGMQSRSVRIINRQRLAVLVLLVAFPATAAAEDFRKSLHMVSMRDGTQLATDVYVPAGDGAYPVIFARGPYGRSGPGRAMASLACGRGYAFVSQDMRGRFDSQGSDAVVFHNDGWSKRRDGHDSLAWIAAQHWCNGKIATYGGSALGITQTMMAPDAPETLKAQFVLVAASSLYHQVAYQGGAWRKALIETWLKSNAFDPATLESYLAHPIYDEFWQRVDAAAQAERVNAPGIYWGGWYDIFLQGTLDSFTSIHNNGGPAARGRCGLIIGPYAHGGFSELVYPANSRESLPAGKALRFFDHVLKGEQNGIASEPAVHYYVMGDPTDPDAPGNYWRAADNWPPPSRSTSYYLHADGNLVPQTAPQGVEQLTYKYDPSHPVLTVGGQNLVLPKGPADQRKVESRPDVLVFSSEELEEPIEVTGRISAKLYVSSNCPDTDFTVKLSDVYPDGRSMLVTDGILRARFRESFRTEQFMEPGKVYELNVDLWSTSLVFNKGHRIRVAVSSSNSPRFEPNPNTGRPFRADKQTRIATNTIHVSSEHPSHIRLPIYVEAPATAAAGTE